MVTTCKGAATQEAIWVQGREIVHKKPSRKSKNCFRQKRWMGELCALALPEGILHHLTQKVGKETGISGMQKEQTPSVDYKFSKSRGTGYVRSV